MSSIKTQYTVLTLAYTPQAWLCLPTLRLGSSLIVTSCTGPPTPEYSVTKVGLYNPPVMMTVVGEGWMLQWLFLQMFRGKLGSLIPPSTGISSVVLAEP